MPRRPGRQRIDTTTRGLIVRFVALVAIPFVAFHLAGMSRFYEARFFPAYLAWNARVSAGVLGLFGNHVRVEGNRMVSGVSVFEVRAGCDAIEPAVLLLLAFLASPVRWRAKAAGIGIGVPALLLLNIVRITTLCVASQHSRSLFEVLHVDVWRPVFMLFAVSLWVGWAMWALRSSPKHHAA